MKFKLMFLLVFAATLPVAPACCEDTWQVAQMCFYLPDYCISIDFTLRDDDVLTLNTTSICTPYIGSSSNCDILQISGNWAVCGTVDTETNELVPDPYATFVYENNPTETRGRVVWAANTPFGYTCPLMLGHSFNGDGAASYQGYDQPVVTSTLVLEWRLTLVGRSYFSPIDHTFYVTRKQPVSIDIHPNEYPNAINRSSHGVVPVAVLSTADFDARKLDPKTVTLAGASVARKNDGTYRSAIEDANKDGRKDVVLFFRTQDVQLNTASTRAQLLGTTISNIPVIGCDTVKVVR